MELFRRNGGKLLTLSGESYRMEILVEHVSKPKFQQPLGKVVKTEHCRKGQRERPSPAACIFFCVWVQLSNQIHLAGHQGNLGNLFVKKI